ncbi:MAG: hypothetical protein K2Q97_02545 [Burkholderiaceae bacterium]|nr:hypothetical protein [Burkholderiaceae bacterium]
MNTPATSVATAPAVRTEGDRQKAARERSRNLGGARLKLEVIGEIPGYHLYWANDEGGEIEQLLEQGYEIVQQKELGNSASKIVADTDVSSKVSRHVGTQADGSPLRAILLKCTDEIWAEKEEWNREAADTWDTAIKTGQVQKDEARYTPKRVTNSIDTQFRKEY